MTTKMKIGCLTGGVIALGVLVVASGVFLSRVRRSYAAERRDVTLTSAVYDAERLREARPLLEAMVPQAASNIEMRLVYTRGGFMGGPKDEIGGLGAGAELRCEVTRKGLLEFAEVNKYVFQSESYVKNFCTAEGAMPECGDWFGGVYERYNGNRLYPEDFRSYNYIYPSCGGFSFFYDTEKEILYASWGSN